MELAKWKDSELPTVFVQPTRSPSLASQLSRRFSGGSRKLCRENAIDSEEMDDNKEQADTDATTSGVIKRRMTLPASTSLFRRTLSDEAKLGDEAAAELEQRLKNLVSAFSARTKRTKEKIARPPTPSISDEEDDLPIEDDDLLGRLRQLCSPGGSEFGGEGRRKSIAQKIQGSCIRKLKKLYNFLTCSYVLDADGWTYINWLIIVSACFLYNAVVIPLRAVFPYQTDKNTRMWQYADCFVDLVYAIDMIAFKSHRKFIKEGFWIKDPVETRKNYFESFQFKIDLVSLFPADILVAITYGNYPLLRLPRLVKLDTYWELFQRFDTILASPHGARITKTLIYMLYMIHINACVYYGLSLLEGLCGTTWTLCPSELPNATEYVRCFYFATKTATSIGKNPRPDNNMEYLYMTFAWLSGVFVTAILIGQIRDIIATATKTQNEYRAIMYAALNYLHRFGVPKKLQNKVKLWLSYTWEQQKTLDESKILDLLPDKMRTDVALDLHVETLSKVKLFHHCEVPFLRDLVTKLKSIIFLPGDYICRKGEVGREMFIIQSGKIHVIGGPSGTEILVTLGEGSIFGEIALLGIGGMNKRTADVRTAGFANLFVLHKHDLEEAIRDYPVSQEIIRKKAQKLMKENIRKAKAAAATTKEEESSTPSTDSVSSFGDEVIIKTKKEPKLIQAMKQIFPPDSKIGLYLVRGSKGVAKLEAEIDNKSLELTSYPPTPYVPGSPNHMSLEVDVSIISGESSEEQLSPPPPSRPRAPSKIGDVFSPFLAKQINERLQGTRKISVISTSSVEELTEYMDLDGDKAREEDYDRCVTPTPLDPRNTQVYESGEMLPSEETDTFPSPSTSSRVKNRETLPVLSRPPVYPILPGSCSGVSLSSSEESEGQDRGKRTGKQVTARVAAIIASRFLTVVRRRQFKKQQSVHQEQHVEGNEEGEEDSANMDFVDDSD